MTREALEFQGKEEVDFKKADFSRSEGEDRAVGIWRHSGTEAGEEGGQQIQSQITS